MELPKKKNRKKIIKKEDSQDSLILINKPESSTNLVQVSTMTFARYDFTLIQSKILVHIIEELQNFIKQAITNEKNHVRGELSLFTDQDYADFNDPTSIRFRIPLSKLSSSCQQYRTVKKAAIAMATIPIEMPYYDKDGQLWREIDNLCRIRIPEKKQVKEIEVVIRKDTAKYLMDVKTMGYTEYLKEVIECSKNQYTPRIYMMLCAYAKRQQFVTIFMKDLRKLFRLEGKYKTFRDFKAFVLETAFKDLKLLAEEGISDFYFTYEKGYKEGKKKAGEPDYIKFTINKNIENEAEDLERKVLMQNHIHDLLRSNHIMMEEDSALEISRQVTMDNNLIVLNKIVELSEIFKYDDNIRNRGAYAYKTLNNLIAEIKKN